MDVTPLFRSVAAGHGSGKADQASRPGCKQKQCQKLAPSAAVFSKQCVSLLRELIELEGYVERYRRHAMTLSSLYDLGGALTSDERMTLNRLAINVIKSCEVALDKLDTVIPRLDPAADSQRVEHGQCVLALLRHVLCQLTERHSSLNAQAYERILDVQRCSKLRSLLQTNHGRKQQSPAVDRPENVDRMKTISPIALQQLEHTYNVEFAEGEMANLQEEKQLIRQRLAVQKRDVEALEQRLSALSDLQKTFAENVLAQEQSINRISDSSVKASDSIADSNRLIKKAMEKQTSTRTCLVFIMVVFIFTLWFLHLYNP